MSAASLPQDFYVYLHRKATTGDVFYVGKGQDRRALSHRGRNRHWKNIVAKHGLVVEIVADRLREWYAHELECELIALHGRRDLGYGPLVNMEDGGQGASGRMQTAKRQASKQCDTRGMPDCYQRPSAQRGAP